MKNILLIITLSLTFNLFGQDLASMKVDVQKTFDATIKLDYDAILDGTYPKLFEIITKEQMRTALVSMLNGNEKMKMNILPVEPDFSFDEIKQIENSHFCIIKHNLSIEMSIAEVEESESEMFIDIVKASMNAKSVTFNKERKIFLVELRSTMIAIYDKFTDGKWKFVNKSKNTAMFKKLLGEKVVSELGL